MSEERKKAQAKPVSKVVPKKRDVEPQKVITEVKPEHSKVITEVKKIEININEVEDIKTKRAENKYIKLAVEAKQDERFQFTSRVKSGEIKFAYVSLEGDKYYHYYQLLKK